MGKDSKPKTAKGAGKGDKGGDKGGAKGGDKGGKGIHICFFIQSTFTDLIKDLYNLSHEPFRKRENVYILASVKFNLQT